MKSQPAYLILVVCSFALGIVSACSFDDSGMPTDDDVTSHSLSGRVVDFETMQAIDGQASIATDGISPPPRVTVESAAFEVAEIPPGSVFYVLAGAPPQYRSTYAGPFEVIFDDLARVDVPVVSEAYIAALFEAFGIPNAPGGVLIAQLVDDDGAPVEGLAAAAFELNGSADFVGPFFLDAEMRPDVELEATSSSGYVVFFEVPAGLVTINASIDSGYSMSMTPSPVALTTVTLATVSTVLGEPALPADVSFKDDVLPVFEGRGCAVCHSKKEIGNEVGGLSLDQRDKRKIHKEVTEEISDLHGVARVDLERPENSLILTEPSAEDPPDTHPNITFMGPTDPDYQLILVWIREGALDN